MAEYVTEHVTRVVDGWAAPGGLGPEKLTRKELLVTHLLLRGYMVDELATVLGNTTKTVKCHITSIYRKLGIQARHELFARVFGFDDMPMPESAWQNQNPRCPQV
jgi:DNA-binding NarL/FixJ family response regulator